MSQRIKPQHDPGQAPVEIFRQKVAATARAIATVYAVLTITPVGTLTLVLPCLKNDQPCQQDEHRMREAA